MAEMKVLVIVPVQETSTGGMNPLIHRLVAYGGDRVAYLRIDPSNGEADIPQCTAQQACHDVSVMPQVLDMRGRGASRLFHWLLNRTKRNALIDHIVGVATQFDGVVIADLEKLGWLIAPLKKRLSVPVSLFVCGDENGVQTAPNAIPKRRRKAAAAADWVFVSSDGIRKLMERKFGADRGKTVLIRGACDLKAVDRVLASNVRALYDLPVAGPVVLGSRPFVEAAQYDVLIEAWPDVERLVPAATLVLAGDGPDLGHLRDCAARSAAERIVILEGLSGDALTAVRKTVSLYVRPSARTPRGGEEASAIATLDAMACGLPVVVGGPSAGAECVENGVSGAVITADTPQSVAAAVIKLLAARDQAKQYGNAAKKAASARTWSEELSTLFAHCFRQ